MDADPSVPFLDGAAFDVGKKAVFTDRNKGVEIELVKKKGKSYLIRIDRSVSTPEQTIAHSSEKASQDEQYPFDGRWIVTVDSLLGCRNNNPRSFTIRINKGQIDSGQQKFPKTGNVSANGNFTITSTNKAGVVINTQTGTIKEGAGEGRLQGTLLGCSGSIKIVRTD